MTVAFSLELAQQYFSSDKQFPIDFEDAWQWLGYSTKANAKVFLKSKFTHGEDYISSYESDLQVFMNPQESLPGKTSSIGGRQSEKIFLTHNCVKEMGMMAGTEQGKLVRKYFLQCEEIAKAKVNQLLPQRSIEDRVKLQTENAARFQELFGMNPTAQQVFKDSILNMMVESNQKALTGDREDWRGIVSLAEELGYKVPIKGDKCRTKLGKFIAENAPHLAQHKEKRLCNEVQQQIYVYPLHRPEIKTELIQLVHLFFKETPAQKPLLLFPKYAIKDVLQL